MSLSPQSPLPLVRDEPDQARWFSDEVQPNEPLLKAYLRGSFPTVRDVDDVVQESYLRIWRARLIHPIRSAKSFLFQIARHLAIDLVRRHRASPIDPVPDPAVLSVIDDGPGVAESACTREEIQLLAQAIDALPPRCRQIMILRQIEGIPQKEIAARLGISVLTVQVHVVKGLRRLEEHFRLHGAAPRSR